MLVNRAGTATYYAKHLRSNHSPFSSELLNNLNLLSNSNSNSSNSSSKEYHRRRCLNNQQTNKMSNNGELFENANGHGGVTLRSPDGPDGSQSQGNGQQTQLPFRESSNAPAQSQQAPIGHPLTQTTSQQVRSSI
jgi:hypothetical protein